MAIDFNKYLNKKPSGDPIIGVDPGVKGGDESVISLHNDPQMEEVPNWAEELHHKAMEAELVKELEAKGEDVSMFSPTIRHEIISPTGESLFREKLPNDPEPTGQILMTMDFTTAVVEGEDEGDESVISSIMVEDFLAQPSPAEVFELERQDNFSEEGDTNLTGLNVETPPRIFQPTQGAYKKDDPLPDAFFETWNYLDSISGEQSCEEVDNISGLDSEGHLTTSAAISKLRESPFAFLTGVAGAGKSYTLNELNSLYPGYNQLAATTGIAGVNLNTTTINSILGFYDLYSLEQAYMEGKLTRKLNKVADEFQALTIDEVSMLSGEKLDIIVVALKEMNKVREGMGKSSLKLWLTGDPLQLPPILKKENHELRWFFESEAWKEFEPNTIKLTRVWRQTNPIFLDALNAIRVGDGKTGAALLREAGVKFAGEIDTRFPGTTIVAKNDKVDAINSLAIMELKRKSGLPVKFTSRRWKQGTRKTSEWESIPDILDLAIGAYVMILSNNRDQGYVNGDCGELLSEVEEDGVRGAVVRLARNSREVTVFPTVRDQFSFEEPYGLSGETQKYSSEGKSVYLEGHYNISAPIKQKSRWLTGQVEYVPLRPAYSSTVHKSQGLTLDAIQCDIRDNFFGQSAMAYVALSRTRDLSGLRIVGTPELLATRVKTDAKVKKFV